MKREANATRAAAFALLAASAALAQRGVIRRSGEIEFTATIHTAAFNGGLMMRGYHAIVWKDGRSAHAALLQADVSDRDVAAALESIGARPGDNLPMEVWEKRRDPGSPAPDTLITGASVEVLLRLPGRNELLPLSAILEDPAGRGVELRFGGNVANIPKFKSGCIVCLYSCPGGKVGNSRYSVRDYVQGVTRFRVRPGALPPDGTRVGVVLRLLPG